MFSRGLRSALLELSVLTLDVWQTVDAGCFMANGHAVSLIVAVAVPAWLVMSVVLVFGIAYLWVSAIGGSNSNSGSNTNINDSRSDHAHQKQKAGDKKKKIKVSQALSAVI
jgi:hypothetical protein